MSLHQYFLISPQKHDKIIRLLKNLKTLTKKKANKKCSEIPSNPKIPSTSSPT